jgi:hypothetical protein
MGSRAAFGVEDLTHEGFGSAVSDADESAHRASDGPTSRDEESPDHDRGPVKEVHRPSGMTTARTSK